MYSQAQAFRRFEFNYLLLDGKHRSSFDRTSVRAQQFLNRTDIKRASGPWRI